MGLLKKEVSREFIAVPDNKKNQIVFKWPDVNIRRFSKAIAEPDEIALFMCQLRHRELVDAPGIAEAHLVSFHRLEIEGLAAVAIFADELEIGQGVEHTLGHRLETDDGGLAVADERDQLVFVHAVRAVVEFCVGIEGEHFLPRRGETCDVIGRDSNA